jgi:hypothetical protein
MLLNAKDSFEKALKNAAKENELFQALRI